MKNPRRAEGVSPLSSSPSQPRLESWLREWQQALRLQDWRLKIEVKREKDMECEACHGLCSYSPALKSGTITVRDSIDFQDGAGYPEDVEATIVHELLHLHFSPFYVNKGLVNTFQEQAIEVIAQSLVGLKRRGEAMASQKSKSKSKPAAGSPPPPKPESKLGKGKMAKGGRGKKGC
jgi:hypothetical protein